MLTMFDVRVKIMHEARVIMQALVGLSKYAIVAKLVKGILSNDLGIFPFMVDLLLTEVFDISFVGIIWQSNRQSLHIGFNVPWHPRELLHETFMGPPWGAGIFLEWWKFQARTVDCKINHT